VVCGRSKVGRLAVVLHGEFDDKTPIQTPNPEGAGRGVSQLGEGRPGAAGWPWLRAEASAQENWNKYLRAAAELDNVRKRAPAGRGIKPRKFGIERLASEFAASGG